MSLIVNEKRLPATIKRLFKNSVSEIVGELLQNSQRANASEIHFHLDREAQTLIVRDDGSGISPDATNWARVLRMADSFYSDGQVEANQKPMGVGLLSLFALNAVKSVSISSRGKCATIETNLLWESEDYWATWTNLITDAPETISGFELTVRYEEPEATFSYNRLAHKFECALTKFGDGGSFAPARGYQNFLKIFLDGEAVDTTLPGECVPAQDDLLYDGFTKIIAFASVNRRIPTELTLLWFGMDKSSNSILKFRFCSKSGAAVPLHRSRRHALRSLTTGN